MDFMSTVSSFFAAKKNDKPFALYKKPLTAVNILAIVSVVIAPVRYRKNKQA